MIVRRLAEAINTEREVGGEDHGWTSRRLLLESDGMGFSLHDTLIHPGKALHLHYKHHLEAVYMIEGKAEIRESTSGAVHELTPGTIYALNAHDEHILRAEVLSRFVCVFNPPVKGQEVHQADGSYPASE